MSDLNRGCYCNATFAPCSWCTDCTILETEIMDEHGMDVLVWLQNHYILPEGSWCPEALQEYTEAEWIKLAKDDILLRKGAFTRSYMHEGTGHNHQRVSSYASETQAALNGIIQAMEALPKPDLAHIGHGVVMVREAANAPLIPFPHEEQKRKADKRRRIMSAYGGNPDKPSPGKGELIPFRRPT